MNLWKPANPNLAVGGAPIFEPIWYLDVINMELIPMLASALPEYDRNFTIMRIRVRPGVYWSDGVEFTADDIVFTLKLHLKVVGLAQSAFTQTWVEDTYAEDKYCCN
jgi:peptide/nickel transport system substrate-binding protein